MLVLKRDVGEEIVITVGDTRIRVMLVQAWTGYRNKPDAGRIGVLAPPEVEVHRAEVQAAIDRDGPLRKRWGAR